MLGVLFGAQVVELCRLHPMAKHGTVADGCSAWDGKWYTEIADKGYSYSDGEMSSVAFLPVFPLAGRVIHERTGMPTRASLLLASHRFLFGAFVLMSAYGSLRWRYAPAAVSQCLLLALGLFPTGFYFRMAYSESTFLFLALAAMLGIQQKWAAPWIAFVIGLATATRLTALALFAPFAVHLWQTSTGWRSFSIKALGLAPLACWGLLAYAAYQHYTFGDGLAFMRTSAHWNHRAPTGDLLEKTVGLLTLESLAAVYSPGSPCYWRTKPPEQNAAFNLFFANPIYFALTGVLVALGYWRGWLNGKETLLGAALLLIPYITHAERGCMASEARYASVVFPAYMTLGQLLARLPAPATAALAALSACLLAAYSALFVSWYWFY